MSPAHCAAPAADAVTATIRRVWAEFGVRVRDARIERRWPTAELARRAGLSRTTIYTVERGEGASVEVAARVAGALGLRLDLELTNTRKRERAAPRWADPVHSLMGELEAGHLRAIGFPTGLDEPYQHYQFAGRADVVAWDLSSRALLHLENRTRFPDLQDTAGTYNAKRAYLPSALAERHGIAGWLSETHVMVALWSSEVLHMLRLRTETFRAICPDQATGFESWWNGQPPTRGKTSSLIVLDPLASHPRTEYLDLDSALVASPRYRGYADAAARMTDG